MNCASGLWHSCIFPPCVTKKKCPLWLRRHRNRVGPSKPIKVIKVSKVRGNLNSSPKNEPDHKINGETNLYFQGGDEVIFNPQLPNGHCSSNENNPQNESHIKSIHLRVGKKREWRVVHILPQNMPDTGSSSVKVQNGNKIIRDSICSSSEDDEDYWFTNWSQRPKLKNPFTVKINNENEEISKLDSIAELNSRASFSYEGLKESEEEIELAIDNLIRKNSNCAQNNIDIESPTNSPSHSSLNPFVYPPITDPFSSFNYPLSKSGEILHETENESHFEMGSSFKSSFTNHAFSNDGDCQIYETPEKIKTDKSKTNGSTPTNINHNNDGEGTNKLENNCSSENNNTLKPLLFFIHGISGSSEIWQSQFDYFHRHGYEILSPDLLGHGLSSTPNNSKYYLFESLVKDLVDIFDHFLAEDRKCVVIGHGYGACLASVLSKLRPVNVIILVSVSGGGPTPLLPHGSLDHTFLPFSLNPFAKVKVEGRFDNPDLCHILPSNIREFYLKGQLWVEGDSAFFRRISVPTLLVYGLRDKVVSLIEECEMERTIPKAFLELLPMAGHMLMWEEPKKFNKMLIKFIQSWT